MFYLAELAASLRQNCLKGLESTETSLLWLGANCPHCSILVTYDTLLLVSERQFCNKDDNKQCHDLIHNAEFRPKKYKHVFEAVM